MKVKVEKSKGNFFVLDVELPKERVDKKFNEVYEKIGQEAKIPGFRPGKAPRHVLEQHHSKIAREEVIKGLITESYQETVKDKSLDVIDLPEITNVKLGDDGFSYSAEVEVKPEIKIKQYRGLKIKKNEIKVTEKEVEDAIEQLKKQRNFEGSPEQLAKGLGYKDEAEFKDCLTKQQYLQKENAERARLEKELIDQVVKASSFDCPASLIDKRAHELAHQAEYQMKNYGLTEDRIAQRLEEFKPKFKTEAEEQVKVFLVLEAIAKLEKFPIDDSVMTKVVEFLFMEAAWE